jgi:DNA mismatch endonuclease (patch repair protein)
MDDEGQNERKKRTKNVTHKIMSSIPSRNTRPEIALRKELFSRGFRYRVNYKKLIGKPDIVFTKVRLAIFVDGDFWHGNNWRLRGYDSFDDELSHYSEYWQKKLIDNIDRDKRVNKQLARDGWIVLRYWESDIKKDLNKVANEIEHWYRILNGE